MSLRTALLVLAIVPGVALAALWAVTSGQTFLDFQRQAARGLLAEKAGQPSNIVYYNLQEERRLSAEALARPDASRTALKQQRTRTDEAVTTFETLSGVSADDAPDEVLDAVGRARAAINQLPAQRTLVDEGDSDQQAVVYGYYTALIAVDLELFSALSHVDNGEVTTLGQPLVDLFWAKEMISRSDAILARAWPSGKLTTEDLQELRSAVSGQSFQADTKVLPYLPDDERTRWQALTESSAWKAKTDRRPAGGPAPRLRAAAPAHRAPYPAADRPAAQEAGRAGAQARGPRGARRPLRPRPPDGTSAPVRGEPRDPRGRLAAPALAQARTAAGRHAFRPGRGAGLPPRGAGCRRCPVAGRAGRRPGLPCPGRADRERADLLPAAEPRRGPCGEGEPGPGHRGRGPRPGHGRGPARRGQRADEPSAPDGRAGPRGGHPPRPLRDLAPRRPARAAGGVPSLRLRRHPRGRPGPGRADRPRTRLRPRRCASGRRRAPGDGDGGPAQGSGRAAGPGAGPGHGRRHGPDRPHRQVAARRGGHARPRAAVRRIRGPVPGAGTALPGRRAALRPVRRSGPAVHHRRPRVPGPRAAVHRRAVRRGRGTVRRGLVPRGRADAVRRGRRRPVHRRGPALPGPGTAVHDGRRPVPRARSRVRGSRR